MLLSLELVCSWFTKYLFIVKRCNGGDGHADAANINDSCIDDIAPVDDEDDDDTFSMLNPSCVDIVDVSSSFMGQ